MKKFIIFIGSFIVLLTVFQIATGLFLTATYQPGVEEAWNKSAGLSSEVTMIGSSAAPSIIIAILAAAVAYLIPEGLRKIKQ